jgi:class 3 adenylate cyclase
VIEMTQSVGIDARENEPLAALAYGNPARPAGLQTWLSSSVKALLPGLGSTFYRWTGAVASKRMLRREAAVSEAERHLMAVLVSDVVGYSRLIELDDIGTVDRYRTLRRQSIEPIAARCGAAMIRHAGDSVLIAFACPVSAIECAIAIQRAVRGFELDVPSDHRIHLRIGISMDRVLIVDNDLHGKGVNVAARLEALASPGEIYVSEAVLAPARDRLLCAVEPLGEKRLKNIAQPVRVYRIPLEDCRDDEIQRTPWKLLPAAPPTGP